MDLSSLIEKQEALAGALVDDAIESLSPEPERRNPQWMKDRVMSAAVAVDKLMTLLTYAGAHDKRND